MSSWSDVGGNPCPGDLGELASRVGVLQAIADHGASIEAQLRSLHGDMGAMRWTGAGSQNVSEQLTNAIPDLTAFYSAHRDASAALHRYVGQLEDLQSRAALQLARYSDAVGDLDSAHASDGDASARWKSADNQIAMSQTQLRDVNAQRTLALAAHQPVTAMDQQVANLHSRLAYQHQLRDQAGDDSTAAKTRANDAEHRKSAARKAIDDLRGEAAADAKSAATAILASIGIVRSDNPFLRAWQNTMETAGHAGNAIGNGFNEFLGNLDNTVAVMGLLTLVLGEVPVVGEVLAGATLVLGELDAGLHLTRDLFRLANGHHSAADLGVLAFDAVMLVPGAKVLGAMSKTGERAFRSVPGVAKRLMYYDDARHAKGIFSSHGIKLPFGVRYRVHVTPKPPTGTGPVKYKSLLVLTGAQTTLEGGKQVYEYGKAVYDASHAPAQVGTAAGPQPSSIQGGSGVPVQGGGGPLQGSGRAVQGSDVAVQGSRVDVHD